MAAIYCSTYILFNLELSELLHELLLIFAVAEGRQDVKEHLKQL